MLEVQVLQHLALLIRSCALLYVQRTINPLWNQTPHETTLLLHLAGTSLKEWETVVSRWVCGFMLGLERILWCFFMLFRVGFMSGMFGALKFIVLKTAKHHKFFCGLGHGVDWAKYVVSCRVGVSCRVCGCPKSALVCVSQFSIARMSCWVLLWPGQVACYSAFSLDQEWSAFGARGQSQATGQELPDKNQTVLLWAF